MTDQELEALKQRREAQWQTYREALAVKDREFDAWIALDDAIKAEAENRKFRAALAAELEKLTSVKPQLVNA